MADLRSQVTLLQKIVSEGIDMVLKGVGGKYQIASLNLILIPSEGELLTLLLSESKLLKKCSYCKKAARTSEVSVSVCNHIGLLSFGKAAWM